MSELATLVGYAVIGLAALGVGRYLIRVAPEFWTVAGWRGAAGLVLGLGGFVWSLYAFGHKNEVSSGELLLGLVGLWGTMILILARSPAERRKSTGSPMSIAQSAVDEDARQTSTITMDTHFAVEHEVYLALRRPEWVEYERAGQVIVSSAALGRPIAYVERRACKPILAAIREYKDTLGS